MVDATPQHRLPDNYARSSSRERPEHVFGRIIRRARESVLTPNQPFSAPRPHRLTRGRGTIPQSQPPARRNTRDAQMPRRPRPDLRERIKTRMRWCPGADSNRYAVRHRLLRPACLPIPPPGQSNAHQTLTDIRHFRRWIFLHRLFALLPWSRAKRKKKRKNHHYEPAANRRKASTTPAQK